MIQGSVKKLMALGVMATLGATLLAGCGSSNSSNSGAGTAAGTNTPAKSTELSGTVTLSGSTALLPLAKDAADKFQNLNSKVQITVTGGGSGTGVKNVADGTSTIGMSDVAAAKSYDSAGLVETDVVLAPFAFIASPDVTVTSLTKQQLIDIFSGKVTNWKDVGGKDEKILIVGRPDNSGSRGLVKNLVMGNTDFTKDITVQNESGGLKAAVASQQGAIGYVDIPYTTDGKVKVLKYNGVDYSLAHLQDGTYPFFGVERMYTKGAPTGAAKAFLDYILSAEYQKSVGDLKFVPISYKK